MSNENGNDVLETTLIEQATGDVPPEVEARLRRHLVAFRQKMEAAPPNRTGAYVSPIRRRWVAALSYAAAAVAVLVVVAVVWLATLGGNGYAQAIERLREARTMTYTFTISAPDPVLSAMQTDVAYKEPGLMRQTGNYGVVAVYDFVNRKGITVDPVHKQYIEATDESGPPVGFLNLIEAMRSLPERASAVLGERELDGRTVSGFLVAEDALEKEVWVDRATGELVRVEGAFVNAPGVKVVMTDFRFDVELDDALFQLTPPDGYARRELAVSEPSEDHLIDFLRLWATTLDADGRFPPTLNPLGLMHVGQEIPATGTLQDFAAPDLTEAQTLDIVFRMTQGLVFVLLMTPENDWNYAGENVALGDAKTAIAWWRPRGSATYRVVYGDLEVLDIPAEQLPTLDGGGARE